MANNMMAVLIEQTALGRIKPHNLLGSLKSNEPLTYGDRWARFRKIRPGEFVVESGKVGTDEPDTRESADSPVEAKLATLDVVIQEVHKSKQEEKK